MKKPDSLDRRLWWANGENSTKLVITVHDYLSHYDTLYQYVQGLVDAGFASEKEILEEQISLMKIELDRINKGRKQK